MSWNNDLRCLARGLELIRRALVETQSREYKQALENSSLKNLVNDIGYKTEEVISNAVSKPEELQKNMASKLSVMSQQAAILAETIMKTSSDGHHDHTAESEHFYKPEFYSDEHFYKPESYGDEHFNIPESRDNQHFYKPESHDTKEQSHFVEKEMHSQPLPKRHEAVFDSERGLDGRAGKKGVMEKKLSDDYDVKEPHVLGSQKYATPIETETSSSDSRFASKVDKEKSFSYSSSQGFNSSARVRPKINLQQKLSDTARERKVPASRISRVANFGGLAARIGIGALAEMTKRSLGIKNEAAGESILDNNPFLTEANAERIVDTLCRVRGAALKLGQIISIQDNSLINPQLQRVFERVRQSADFMPAWQMEKVLSKELGSDWREKLASFDDVPFAAASIGQVHKGVLHDGRQVALKIQYPGVATSIDSDINNLMSILKMWQILPEGLYLENLMKVARRELRWEVDYIREAMCMKRFRSILEHDNLYYVPQVIDDLTTKLVLTTEYVEGMSLDKCVEFDEETKDKIGERILNLCLREVFEWQFMQTDPNWSNFLYNPETDKIVLLDFGASREFDKSFVDEYIRVIRAASDEDRSVVLDGSRKMGFLTGYETKVMEEAHIDAVMILGEAFAHDSEFDFSNQTTAKRIQNLVPIMLKYRLTPPPEETYSLHRKMSGSFLLCTKLQAKINCRQLFEKIWKSYRFGNQDLI